MSMSSLSTSTANKPGRKLGRVAPMPIAPFTNDPHSKENLERSVNSAFQKIKYREREPPTNGYETDDDGYKTPATEGCSTPSDYYPSPNRYYNSANSSPRRGPVMIVDEPLNNRQIEIKKLQENFMSLNQQLSLKARASRDAAQRTRVSIQQSLLVKKTTTTRPKKFRRIDYTENRGNPNCVSGMKSIEELEMEDESRKHAVSMMNDQLNKFNPSAGIAAFSQDELIGNFRRPNTLLGPIL